MVEKETKPQKRKRTEITISVGELWYLLWGIVVAFMMQVFYDVSGEIYNDPITKFEVGLVMIIAAISLLSFFGLFHDWRNKKNRT